MTHFRLVIDLRECNGVLLRQSHRTIKAEWHHPAHDFPPHLQSHETPTKPKTKPKNYKNHSQR